MTQPTSDNTFDLLNKLLNCKRPYKIVPFPREENGQPIGYIAMTPLTQSEEIECNEYLDVELRLNLKKKGLDAPKDGEHAESFHNVYTMKQAVEILFRACRRPGEVEKKLFSTKEQMSQLLSKTEMAILVKQYIMVQHELGPVISQMSQSEMDALIDRLAGVDNKETFFLITSCLSLAAMNELLMHLVSRSQNSPTGNGSVGLPESDIVDVV
jgi:hypothetical protein